MGRESVESDREEVTALWRVRSKSTREKLRKTLDVGTHLLGTLAGHEQLSPAG